LDNLDHGTRYRVSLSLSPEMIGRFDL
jgi:hypothetical protein